MKTREEMRAYFRAHYQANKEKWREKRKRWEAKMRAVILKGKDVPCSVCALKWPPEVMEHDHRPGTIKCFNLGDPKARAQGLETILAEMAKCDVLCPTCHRIRTLIRSGILTEDSCSLTIDCGTEASEASLPPKRG